MKHSHALRAIALVLGLVPAVVLGCADQGPPEDPAAATAGPDERVDFAPAERVDPAEWRDKITHADPAIRAAAADAVPGAPGKDGASVLQELVRTDPNPRVRERAVVSFGALAGREGVSFLRSIALADESPDVGAAARAELHRIQVDLDAPARGFLKVAFPEKVTPEEPFDVRVTFGASEEVPEVLFDAILPRGVELAPDQRSRFRGRLAAKEEKELRLTLVAHEGAEGSARLRVKLDYPEKLDVEVIQKKLRIVAGGGTGTVTEIAPPVAVTR